MAIGKSIWRWWRVAKATLPPSSEKSSLVVVGLEGVVVD